MSKNKPSGPGANQQRAVLPNRVTVPQDGIAHGQLVFPRGAARVTVVADATLTELMVAQFEGRPAAVDVIGGLVTVRMRQRSLAELARTALLWGRAVTTLRLSAAVPWAIAVRGGASQLAADFRVMRLTELQITGGVSELTLDLPRPVGVVRVLLAGGASDVRLRRPPGVPVHLGLSAGASQLVLDSQYIHALAGPAQLIASEAMGADCYVITVLGGMSQFTVDTWEPTG